MRGKTLQNVLLAGLGLLIGIIVMEMRPSAPAPTDGCYTMNAPSEPTICS
jgi:hypothetical protein